MSEENEDSIYDYIKRYMEINGKPPCYREIQNYMGFNKIGSVEYYLTKLEEKKRIIRKKGGHRSIKLTGQDSDIPVRRIPVKGKIPAGDRLDIYPDSRNEWLYINIEGELGSGDFYALIVTGDSMRGDNISEGDYVIIREGSTCDNGDIVVAVHKDSYPVSSTLKRFAKDEDSRKLYLKPSNKNYSTTVIDEDVWGREWEIQGKAVAIFRRVGETLKSKPRTRFN